MDSQRLLVVVADDFGIGPETSRGILELGLERRVTATVLMVNSPYAVPAVEAWERRGYPLELGWHPCLTLDAPIAPATAVPSLVDGSGQFWKLGPFLKRVATGRIRYDHVVTELTAQYQRFRELVGRPPILVNSHQHVALFPPVGRALLAVLDGQRPRPFLRNNGETAATLWHVPGARLKRLVLNALGKRFYRTTSALGYASCETFLGVTDPACVTDDRFLKRWLIHGASRSMELMCHPGYEDATLVGRDCCRDDVCVTRRVRELRLLRLAAFDAVRRRLGYRLTVPSELIAVPNRRAA